jgi:hypothetical protein
MITCIVTETRRHGHSVRECANTRATLGATAPERGASKPPAPQRRMSTLPRADRGAGSGR